MLRIVEITHVTAFSILALITMHTASLCGLEVNSKEIIYF